MATSPSYPIDEPTHTDSGSFTRHEDVTLPEAALGSRLDRLWRINITADAGEAVAVYMGERDVDADPDNYSDTNNSTDTNNATDSSWAALSEEERQQRNEERAVRRAKGQSRRFIVANGLRYMWVLTVKDKGGLHGPAGRAEIMRRVAAFVVSIRTELNEGEPLAYWYSPELHPGGHGWHVNLFVGRTLDWDAMGDQWGHGYVFVSDWVKKTKSKGRSVREGIRAGARYGCKYASKDWDRAAMGDGAHRYERAQGFDPVVVGRWCRSSAEAEAWLLDNGFEPRSFWSSEDAKDWDGPKCRWWGW